MKTDSLFYRLFQTYPQLLFELIGDDLNSPQNYRFRFLEVKQTAFRLDGVFVPPEDNRNLPLFFIEVQFQTETEFYSRVFSEIFLYLRQYNPVNPWKAVIIYPSRSINKQSIPQVRELVSQTKEMIGERQEQLKLLDLIETIIVYKLPRLSREEIQKMLGLTEIDLRQTQFYRDVRTETSLELVLKQLTRRFGTLKPSTIQEIQALTLEQLEQLAESLLDFTSIEDLETWLSR